MPLLDQGAADEWTTTLCQCGQDPAGSCDHILCGCCQYGRQCRALEGMSNELDPRFCLLCFLSGIFVVGPPLMVCQMRGKVRERYEISGNPIMDCLVSLFCLPCAHCLNGREQTNRGFWPGGSLCSRSPPGGVG
jgi:Cys-rich protein (TIGR01571 family)